MPDLKSIQQVADIVEHEGLGYAIQHYLNADTIADEELSVLWRIARKALDGISAILEADDEGPEDGI